MHSVFWRFNDRERWQTGASAWHGQPKMGFEDAEGSYFSFGGKTDAFTIPENPLAGWPAFVCEARFRPRPGGEAEQRFVHIQCEASADRALLELRSTPDGWYADVFLCVNGEERFLNDPALLHPFDRWTTLRLTYTGREIIQSVDGKEELRASAAPGALTAGCTSIGRRLNGISPFRGDLAWVRFAPLDFPADPS